MTAPYWPSEQDWAGFLLVLVPAGPLPVPGEELCRQVRARIETDPVLYDLVTVRLAPALGSTADWDRGFVNSVVEAAMPDGHFFAPRGVVGVVVVSADKETMRDAFDGVRDLQSKLRMWTRTFGVGVRAASNTEAAPATVERITSAVQTLIEQYDEEPDAATAEPAFLGLVGSLVEQGYVSGAAVKPVPPRPAADDRPPAEPRPQPVPSQRPADEPTWVTPPEPETQAPAAKDPEVTRPLLAPVMYDGPEMITVDQRTTRQRLTRQHETDADCMDELQRDGRAVGLVHFVFVPDDGAVLKAVTKRRNEIALEFDDLLASVRRDAMTGQPARIAVEVLSATTPLRKHGVLHVAGDLVDSALPKVTIEYFSANETLPLLLDAARRTSRALAARGVDVVSQHFVFLAAMRFPADDTTERDWVTLLNDARVTWIDFSSSDGRLPLHPMPLSPYGLHVLTDKEDVLALVKEQSEVLYRYAQQPPPTAAAAPSPEARRWWPFGKRATE